MTRFEASLPFCRPRCLALESILVRYSSRLSGARPSSQAATPGRLGSSWGITATKTRSSFSRTASGQSFGNRVATPYFGASNGSVGGRSMTGSAGDGEDQGEQQTEAHETSSRWSMTPGMTWNWLVVPGDCGAASVPQAFAFLDAQSSEIRPIRRLRTDRQAWSGGIHGEDPRKSGHRCTECRFQLRRVMADDSSSLKVERALLARPASALRRAR